MRWLCSSLVVLLLACGGNTSEGTGGGTSTGGSSSGEGGSAAVGGGGMGQGGMGTTLEPKPEFLPTPTGACPAFTPGTNTFSPAGIAPRDVEIWIGPNATASDGPLLFYWHGTGSSPVNEPPYGLEGMIDAVESMGGIVAAPHHDPAAGTFPWFLTTGTGKEDDLLLADEILACAIENVGIDLRHIHSIGMSAGGLNTTQMSYRRSGYLASVVPYSGGLIGQAPDIQDPTNPFAAMIFHGGPSDQVVVSFQPISEAYQADLAGRGHFAFICDHGEGHTIPKKDNVQDAIWQFFMAHP
ncbi:MAG: hypothetical protein KC933_39955, partial [Myxococcales bacterium]|nr:hypothetical protein [Myxococcales bacterium]